MSPAWMPLYIADYLKDTVHLSAAEHGAYMLLIMRYWQDGGLPEDERLIARFSRLQPAEWEESRDVLASLFGPNWSHPRIDEELAKAAAIIDKRRHAAEQMHAKRNAKNDAHASANAEHVHCESSDTRVPYLSPSPRQEEQNEAIASSSDPVSEMVDVYHEAMAPAGCPRVLKLTPSRKASALQRLKDCGGMDGWRHAMAKARASPFLTGASANGWKADFDFFMQARSFTKLLEGSYDARKPSGGVAQPKPLTGSSALLAAARSRLGPIPDGGGGEAGVPRGLDAQRDGSGVYRLADRGH